jgi:hypothetical protein|tara:strand:- start:20189 stop:20536 length:348 start_codon:yes stop_codon:yes gene_type:complete
MDIDDEIMSMEAATRLRRKQVEDYEAACHLVRLRKDYEAAQKTTGKQVGGTHYEDMGLQPLDATYMRYGYAGVKAALHCKIDKYIGRDKHDELADLKKARHCIDMLIEYKEKEDE